MDFPLFGPDRAFGSNLGRSETQTPLGNSGGLEQLSLNVAGDSAKTLSVLVLPLTTTNTKLVLFFSTFECRHFARVPGALHARESSHEKQ